LETIDDLRDGGETLESILAHPLYRRQLQAHGNNQIVMIGYSDSTKDGGYLAANWALYQGQIRLAETARTHGVRLVFFHGRGGSLGRGGGPAAEGILALPPDTLRFGLRVTEQGEVLAERYGDPDIAYRHLEQLLWATVTAAGTGRAGSEDRWHATMQELAEDALSEYRGLIGTEGFVRYFERATPLEEIEVLPIASRPARRAGERSLDNLRAIPWVFSWSESRVLLPAWFGLGAAVERYADKHGWDTLREMYDEWRFFRTVIDNAALALAKTDMPIAERYAGLVEDRELGERLFRWISEEHRRTATAIVRVTGSDALLDTTPWLRDAVRKRNPFTLPLNLLQVIWLERARAGEPEAQAEAHEVVRLTIQGVASALRNTG
jgi:phosphoenolpyruvate carboxylase